MFETFLFKLYITVTLQLFYKLFLMLEFDLREFEERAPFTKGKNIININKFIPYKCSCYAANFTSTV